MKIGPDKLSLFMRYLAFYTLIFVSVSVYFQHPDVALKTLEYLIAGLAGAIFAWTRGQTDDDE